MPWSFFYYTPRGKTGQSLALVRLIKVQFLETSFFGVRQIK